MKILFVRKVLLAAKNPEKKFTISMTILSGYCKGKNPHQLRTDTGITGQ